MKNKLNIYLDNNSTTIVDPKVIESMSMYYNKYYGNPSSTSHEYGLLAEDAVDNAREQVATLLGSSSSNNIIFTSGATESNNLAICGVIDALPHKRKKHIITTKIEHPSVIETCRKMEREGVEVTYVGVNHEGRVNPNDILREMRKDTVLVSVILGNNEVGTIQPIKEIASIAHEYGALFHTDATQAITSMEFNVDQLGVDLATISAHKFYGPKGVGALYVRLSTNPVNITGQICGGVQQGGLRAGTINVPGVVGLGKAAELVYSSGAQEREHVRKLRDRLLNKLREQIQDIKVNGSIENRIVSNLNVSFLGVSALSLFSVTKGISFSTGSACSSGTGKISHVLEAMKLEHERIHSSVRFGVGRFTTEEEIDEAAKIIGEGVSKLLNKKTLR
ncbi:cysteine desulfurase family protein [Clostridium sp. UBA7503]|uniref:cysteine desulfurase family protein n=1 Tax=Clostridium sp. UBA7503 TaxID=1946377 RepID=UPI0032178BCD